MLETSNRMSNGVAVVDRAPDFDDVEQEARIAQPMRSFAGVDALELAESEHEDTEWLVKYVLSADQPTIFGAASKATKTTQLVDLSVALATCTPWLDNFEIPKVRKVLFITGESSKRAISRRIKRSLVVRGLDWADVQGKLRVEAVDFPTLPNAEHQVAIQNDVAQHGIEVVIIDPLYRGLGGLDTNRMAEMGSAIVEFAKCCQPASLIISHHIIKSAAREQGPPTLESLSGAGIAESCGNWWLIGRNEPYQFDKKHDLAVTYGGREEQAGFIRIKFDEAEWDFDITSGQDIRDQRQRERDEKKQEANADKLRQTKAGVQHALANEKTAKPMSWIEARSGHPKTVTRVAVAEMLNDGTMVEQDYKDKMNRTQTGKLLASNADVRRSSPILAKVENGEHVDGVDVVAANPPLGDGDGGDHQQQQDNNKESGNNQSENRRVSSREDVE